MYAQNDVADYYGPPSCEEVEKLFELNDVKMKKEQKMNQKKMKIFIQHILLILRLVFQLMFKIIIIMILKINQMKISLAITE